MSKIDIKKSDFSRGCFKKSSFRKSGFRNRWLLPLLGAMAAMVGCVGYGYPGTGHGDGYRPSDDGYYPSGSGYGNTVRCESNDNRTKYCNADTRGGVRLSRRLSDAQCIQGRSWGYDSRRIWVSRGCRAEFVTGSGGSYGPAYGDPGLGNPAYGNLGYGNERTVRCESNDNRTKYCNENTRGGVRLSKRLSHAQCIQGSSWGYDSRGIWVSHGCRGEFIVGAGGGYGPGYVNPGQGNPGYGNPAYDNPGYGSLRTVRCESNDNRYQHCNMDTRGGVAYRKRLSDAECIQGRTWGYDKRGVWVSHGCRAEFSTGSGISAPDYGNGQTVRCESQDGRMRRCDVRIQRGVQLIRQLSSTRCVERQNWGWDRNGIWVDNGCRAEFRAY